MTERSAFKWEFKPRFRKGAFGWRSPPALQRVKQAVAEIKKVSKKDPVLGAEGAVIFLERVSPALEHVDSSSGAIGSAVYHAIGDLAAVIAAANVDAVAREAWLERIWEAQQEDDIPYLEGIGDHWGRMCADKAIASRWADELIGTVRMAWSPDPSVRGHFKGATNCLTALLAAERFDELMRLLEMAPYKFWHYRKFGVQALLALGRKAEALRYAEDTHGLNEPEGRIAEACEAILLSSGMKDEAYDRYAIRANQAGTYAATFRAIRKKYPHKGPATVLADLAGSTPGEEGKWFAAAKDAGLYDEALALAAKSPCDPRTLTRAARDHADTHPAFALGAGLAALTWLARGYGYEVTGADVWAAHAATLEAARKVGTEASVREQVRAIVVSERGGFMAKVLGREVLP